MRPSKITEFGRALKAKMDSDSWTAPRLATALDVSRAMVYEYLRGAEPGLRVRIAAQMKLGINLTGPGTQLFLPDFLKTLSEDQLSVSVIRNDGQSVQLGVTIRFQPR